MNPNTTKFRNMLRFFCFLLFSAFVLSACAQNTEAEVASQTDTIANISEDPQPHKTLQEILAENHISKSSLKIKIDKSAYTLSVVHADTVLIVYPCVFGFNAVDDKAQEGDGCTPEGTFGIRSMYAHKSWKYFIWIDYPNAESWRRFNRRKANGELAANATIGGEVGIHGVPEGGDYMIDNQSNWTLGCISLKNADIEDLYKSITAATQVEIIP